MRRPPLLIAVTAGLAVALLTAIVVMHPFLPIDATVEKDV